MKYVKHLITAACAALIVTTGVLQAGDVKPGDKGQQGEKHEKQDKDKKGDAKEAKGDKQDDRAIIHSQRWSYPLDTCPVSGEKLEAKPTEFVVNGRMVRTCCGDCKAQVMKDPSEVFKKLDAAVIAAQKSTYPMKTCAISGKELDDKAIDYVFGTRLVRLENREAVAMFMKDPAAAMAKVDEAYIKAQLASYPLKKCVVGGEELGGMGEPVNKLYGTTLVRFCCAGCIKSFEKEPTKYLKEIAEARKTPPSKS
ncbi:MAG: hypothetical protein JNL28_14015 [Planctomycetes bacterium]|nr:hypothetical protein [Planctomycetota bacterium]